VSPGFATGSSPHNLWTVTPGITLRLAQDSYPVATSEFTLILENRTDFVMHYGQGWEFERYQFGGWRPVKTIANYAWHAIGYTLQQRSKQTVVIPTFHLDKPLGPGLYRITGCSLRVARDDDYLGYTKAYQEYGLYQLEFQISESASPEPEAPEQILGAWQLPAIEDWQWYTPWDCIDMYERSGMHVWQYLQNGKGLVAVLYRPKQAGRHLQPGDKFSLDLFDRQTGRRYVVFSELTVETVDVTNYQDGFLVVSDGQWYCWIDSGGEVMLEPVGP